MDATDRDAVMHAIAWRTRPIRTCLGELGISVGGEWPHLSMTIQPGGDDDVVSPAGLAHSLLAGDVNTTAFREWATLVIMTAHTYDGIDEASPEEEALNECLWATSMAEPLQPELIETLQRMARAG